MLFMEPQQESVQKAGDARSRGGRKMQIVQLPGLICCLARLRGYGVAWGVERIH